MHHGSHDEGDDAGLHARRESERLGLGTGTLPDRDRTGRVGPDTQSTARDGGRRGTVLVLGDDDDGLDSGSSRHWTHPLGSWGLGLLSCPLDVFILCQPTGATQAHTQKFLRDISIYPLGGKG
jgi:hypothetical protein